MNETVLNSAMIASIIIGYFVGIALVTTSFYRSRANNYLALSLFLIASITFLELPSIDLNITFFQVLILFRFDFLPQKIRITLNTKDVLSMILNTISLNPTSISPKNVSISNAPIKGRYSHLYHFFLRYLCSS